MSGEGHFGNVVGFSPCFEGFDEYLFGGVCLMLVFAFVFAFGVFIIGMCTMFGVIDLEWWSGGESPSFDYV
jgi:hypothetical protein